MLHGYGHGYTGPGLRSFFEGSSNFHLEQFSYTDKSRNVHGGNGVDASYNVTYADYSGAGTKGAETLVLSR